MVKHKVKMTERTYERLNRMVLILEASKEEVIRRALMYMEVNIRRMTPWETPRVSNALMRQIGDIELRSRWDYTEHTKWEPSKISTAEIKVSADEATAAAMASQNAADDLEDEKK